jgi:hypothetical protein
MRLKPYSWVLAFETFSQGLHRAHDKIVDEPLPERWLDLINRLDAQEAGGQLWLTQTVASDRGKSRSASASGAP